jgi:hypothetical protein
MDDVHRHCGRKHGHQQVEKRDQHANGANETQKEARQFLDAALPRACPKGFGTKAGALVSCRASKALARNVQPQ